MDLNTRRIQEGTLLLESIWFSYACKIVEKAIRIYGLDEKQARALRETYLKPNNFQVRCSFP